jgi:TRAP transporter 4TM/12TM fusion protein
VQEDRKEIINSIYRSFPNQNFKNLLVYIAAAAAIYHIVVLFFIPTNILQFRAIHMLTCLVLVPIMMPATKRSSIGFPTLLDWLLIAMALSSTVYIIVCEQEIVYRTGVSPTVADVVFGSMLLIVILEVTRRAVGLPLMILALCFIGYALFGSYLPSIFMGRSVPYSRVISYLYSLDFGVYGIPIGVSSTYVFLFLLFGAFLKASKIGDFYINFSYAVAGKSRGGPAKVSSIASALFGTISGSGIANVVTTGSFTIPMMKKYGFDPIMAGAVESVASTGGQFMPPLMGAGAFLLAQTIGIPYSDVCIKALIPAIVYYITIYFIIDFYSAKKGLQGIAPEELPDLKKVMATWWYLTIPLFVLLYFLLFARVSPLKAAFYSIIASIICSWFNKDTRLYPDKIIKALADGTESSLNVISACATAGLISGLVGLTGVGIKFTSVIISMAGDSLILSLILAMLITMILSMGLNTTAAYIVSAALVAPALTKLGISPLQAHFFIFYFACLSGITPPVCLVAYPAGAIANANPFRVGLTSFLMAMPAYILPYMAVFGPALLMEGTPLQIIRAIVTSVVGGFSLAAAFQGWLLIRLKMYKRVMLVIASLLLFSTTIKTDIIGFLIIVFVFVSSIFAKQKVSVSLEKRK